MDASTYTHPNRQQEIASPELSYCAGLSRDRSFRPYFKFFDAPLQDVNGVMAMKTSRGKRRKQTNNEVVIVLKSTKTMRAI